MSCRDNPERYLAVKVVMMPRDTNPYGTIFGGVILSYIDQAGAIGALNTARRSGWPERPLVSVAMNSVEFHRPVFVGDVVSFLTRVVRVGRTSVTMHVDVEADRRGEGRGVDRGGSHLRGSRPFGRRAAADPHPRRVTALSWRPLSEAMAIARAHQRAGRLDLAEAVCRQILAAQPRHAEAEGLLRTLGRADHACRGDVGAAREAR